MPYWILAVAAAVGGQAAPTPVWRQPPVQVISAPVVLARGTTRLPGDRRAAIVELWMTSGAARPEGCAENYVFCGRVALQVQRKGRPTVITPLNGLVGNQVMCFDPPLDVPFRVEDLDGFPAESALGDAWPLGFGDFNHDGTPDLALGEHTCHDFNRYSLFSISASGEVRRLGIDPEGVFFVYGYGLTPDMSEVKMTPDGFQTTVVDRSVDPVMEVTSVYHWSSSANKFLVTTNVKELTEHP